MALRTKTWIKILPVVITVVVAIALDPFDLTGRGVGGSDSLTAQTSEAIIGGRRARGRDYPTVAAQVTIKDEGDHRVGWVSCTGTLIAPTVILSAAHCIPKNDDPVELFYVWGSDLTHLEGINPKLPRTKSVRVVHAMPHPEYSAANFYDGGERIAGLHNARDIALMFLEEPIHFVEPARLPDAFDTADIDSGTLVDIVGYGRTSNDGNDYGHKYMARTAIGEVGTFEFQVGGQEPAPRKCVGDSGGPTFLVPQEDEDESTALTVIGVTSRAWDTQAGCAKAGIDARVDANLDFLLAELRVSRALEGQEIERLAIAQTENAAMFGSDYEADQVDMEGGCNHVAHEEQSRPSKYGLTVLFATLALRRSRRRGR